MIDYILELKYSAAHLAVALLGRFPPGQNFPADRLHRGRRFLDGVRGGGIRDRGEYTILLEQRQSRTARGARYDRSCHEVLRNFAHVQYEPREFRLFVRDMHTTGHRSTVYNAQYIRTVKRDSA